MTIVIWILKGVTSILFAFTGLNKMFFSKGELLDKGMKGVTDLDEKQIKAAGLLEVMGAFGLILPTLVDIYPVLSPIAALCLGSTMIVAGWVNHKLKLSIIPNVTVFVLCVLIAYLELK